MKVIILVKIRKINFQPKSLSFSLRKQGEDETCSTCCCPFVLFLLTGCCRFVLSLPRGFSVNFIRSTFAICQLIDLDQNFKLGTVAASNWIRAKLHLPLPSFNICSIFRGRDAFKISDSYRDKDAPPALYLARNPHPRPVAPGPGVKDR